MAVAVEGDRVARGADLRGQSARPPNLLADGFDGTWVAHPDLSARRDGSVRTRSSGPSRTRSDRKRDDVNVTAKQGCSTSRSRAATSPRLDSIRNVSVGIRLRRLAG